MNRISKTWVLTLVLILVSCGLAFGLDISTPGTTTVVITEDTPANTTTGNAAVDFAAKDITAVSVEAPTITKSGDPVATEDYVLANASLSASLNGDSGEDFAAKDFSHLSRQKINLRRKLSWV